MGLLLVTTGGKDMVRFGLSALNANEYEGSVNVNNYHPDNLSIANSNEGGRLAEEVKTRKRPALREGLDVFTYGSSPSFIRVFFFQPPSIRPISCSRSWR